MARVLNGTEMISLIVITEVCEEGSITGSYDYDLLPNNIKNVVSIALNPTHGSMNDFSTNVNIYKDGIQYLFSIKHPEVKIGANVVYKGSVILYHDYDKD